MICNRNFRFILAFCFLCIIGFGAFGAFPVLKSGIFLFSADKKEKLRDLAYDVNPKKGYTVYLKEDNMYVPYLVVTSNYGGKVLLLRQELLENRMPFKKNERHMWASYENGGYYEDSSIDQYLNDEFINRFSRTVQDTIVNSEIIITSKNSLGDAREETIEISRKVFLLSLKELDGPKSYVSVPEGDTLKFFSDNYKRRIAYFPNGEESPYWTRTPSTWETYTVFTIGRALGTATADIDTGVRPAFCLEESVAIKKSSDIISGQTVYVIE
ncbi:hypothetical protein AMS62_06380 [Bacillus sp. FJAT-18019]|nr:hypothetical protein AMS62_06380 [Bacillus sp. FJAT-18019]